MFNLPLSHINVKFILDGKPYDVDHFDLGFMQPTDYKGQPQHEVKGGQFTVVLTQIADDMLYQWAKVSTQRKDGLILFQTDVGMTVFRIEFENAYCISLLRDIDAMKGSTTTLTISSEIIKLNGLEHDNFWPEKR